MTAETVNFLSPAGIPLAVSATNPLPVSGGGGGGGGTSSAYGAAFPANGTAAGYFNSSTSLMAPAKVDVNDFQMIVGNVPAGGADSGNGVKISGVFSSSLPSLTNGERGDLQLTNASLLMTVISGATGTLTSVSPPADAKTNSTSALIVSNFTDYYNGTTWDRGRSVVPAEATAGIGIAATASMGYHSGGANPGRALGSTTYNSAEIGFNGTMVVGGGGTVAVPQDVSTLPQALYAYDGTARQIATTNYLFDGGTTYYAQIDALEQSASANLGAGVTSTEEAGKNYTYIVTATTTVVKLGRGNMHTITVNGGATGTITMYDNTAGSGTVIGIIAVPATFTPFTLTYDIQFNTGLTIVTSAATNITVSTR
jgi:hypothetical protein